MVQIIAGALASAIRIRVVRIRMRVLTAETRGSARFATAGIWHLAIHLFQVAVIRYRQGTHAARTAHGHNWIPTRSVIFHTVFIFVTISRRLIPQKLALVKINMKLSTRIIASTMIWSHPVDIPLDSCTKEQTIVRTYQVCCDGMKTSV